MSRKFEITDAKGGAAIAVRVTTRAAQTEIVGFQTEEGEKVKVLKIRLKAEKAGDPDANKELIEFLAKQLEIPATRVEIVAGESGREKMVSLEGITVDFIEEKFSKVDSDDAE